MKQSTKTGSIPKNVGFPNKMEGKTRKLTVKEVRIQRKFGLI